MEKANMHSLDMVNENIKKIGSIFPECVTETVDENGNVKAAIDFEKLQENLSHATIGEGEERYQFTWPGKREAIHNANASTSMTLRPCKEESVDFDNTENLYIEGDNLEVLKLLQENYLGKVKMIYIDPPYNTGNDFVYNDGFKEDTESFQSKSGMYDEDGNMLLQKFEKNTESNGRFHTDWLNMMYPRLKIARNLLSDDGVIFISIDDNEQENLKKICDEIFGERNYASNLVWQKKTGASDAKGIATITENILVYAKNSNLYEKTFTKNSESYDLNRYRFKDEFEDYRGPYYIDNLDRGGLQYSDSLNYGIECPDGTITYPNGRTEFKKDGWIWKWSKQKIEWARKNKFIEFRKTDKKTSGWAVCYKNYLKVDNDDKPIERAAPHKNLVVDILNANAAAVMKDLFGTNNYFDYAKPMELIKKFLSFVKNDKSIILDFFSGSATTAHAVMQLNAEDGGKRKFICVQLPEATAEDSEAYKAGYKNICEIGKERIRRAGKKIMDDIIANNETSAVIARSETTKQSKDSAIDCRASLAMTQNSQLKTDNYKLDIGFRVLKLAESNMKDVYYSPAETDSADIFDVNNVKEDRTPLDLLFQVMPECNLPLSSKIEERTIEGKTVYFVNGNYLVACFDEGITEKLIKSVIDVPDSDKPYYFYMRNLGLESDKVLDNFEQLFVHYSPTTKRKVI